MHKLFTSSGGVWPNCPSACRSPLPLRLPSACHHDASRPNGTREWPVSLPTCHYILYQPTYPNGLLTLSNASNCSETKSRTLTLNLLFPLAPTFSSPVTVVAGSVVCLPSVSLSAKERHPFIERPAARIHRGVVERQRETAACKASSRCCEVRNHGDTGWRWSRRFRGSGGWAGSGVRYVLYAMSSTPTLDIATPRLAVRIPSRFWILAAANQLFLQYTYRLQSLWLSPRSPLKASIHPATSRPPPTASFSFSSPIIYHPSSKEPFSTYAPTATLVIPIPDGSSLLHSNS
ncbi:hypothetical protein BZA05DRAFT_410457 [Tricharina praecox]|uniref:uncharacterized protein n=1 Tax=Tricharina praecox TaxID=43433 RepID=UPI002220AA71|nr:uncharacterized protein BZA05DRAFT_410457 [Tricharina praecox]KAI5843722.1 hypothetical protein BZA05DRAFT_410457 [Tricharina praecox]